VIDAMRLAGHLIHNEVAGHGHRDRGLVHTSVVASLYEAPDAPPIDIPAILIRIPQLWTPQMSPAQLIRGDTWVVGCRTSARARQSRVGRKHRCDPRRVPHPPVARTHRGGSRLAGRHR
jgi:hypothetical protein